jgi:hypothetical protein
MSEMPIKPSEAQERLDIFDVDWFRILGDGSIPMLNSSRPLYVRSLIVAPCKRGSEPLVHKQTQLPSRRITLIFYDF